MRKVILLCLAMVLAMSCVACSQDDIGQEQLQNTGTTETEYDEQEQTSKNVTLWIDPNGNDDNPGTEQEPIATTQEALRRLRAEPYDSASVVYALGTHVISEAVELEKGDHDITFSSAEGGQALISGAFLVTGWKTETVNGIEMWVAQMDEDHRTFQSLYSEEGNLPRSRWPKDGYFFVRSSQDASAPDSGGLDHVGRYAMYVNKDDIQEFYDPENVTIKILHSWKDETLNIQKLNSSTGRIEFSKPSTFRVESGERFYYENVFEALSEPGEWYMDQVSGKLYYVPMPDDVLGETELYASAAEQFLVCKGAVNISFQNLSFAMGDWSIPEKTVNADGSDHHQAAYDVTAAFDISNTQGISFLNCSFSHINSTCLKFGYCVQGITVSGNTFRDIGANAVFLVGQNADKDSKYVTKDFVITNNHIDGYGQKFFNGTAIGILHAASGEISNNEIHDGYSIAVTVGWVWGYGSSVTSDILVKQNLIYDVGQYLLSDMGAIYTLGVKEGIVITENVIHNVNVCCNSDFSKQRSKRGCGWGR